MFVFLGILFFALGCIPLLVTIRKSGQLSPEKYRQRLKVSTGILVADVLLLIAFNVFCHYYTELLWFRNLEFEQRFWTVLNAKILFFAAGTAIAFVFMYANLRFAFSRMGIGVGRFAMPTAGLLAVLLGLWTSGLWEELLLFINQVGSSTGDPIFGKPLNFYLFELPLYSAILGWLIFLAVLTLGIILLVLFARAQHKAQIPDTNGKPSPGAMTQIRSQILFLLSLPLLLLAGNSYLNIFRLMYSDWGAVTGAGYVDVHFRVLGYQISIALFALLGALLLVSAFSHGFRSKLLALREDTGAEETAMTARTFLLPFAVVALLVLVTWVIPGVMMALKVKPNEITLEAPFIEHNIQFTRLAYGIDSSRIEEREYRVGMNITPEVAEKNPNTLQNIRLWDWRALRDNLKEQQEIRLYYEFSDVDIDRYHLDGQYRQVMLTIREMQKNQLDPRSQTWVSRHLKYTHGHGLVLLPVHEFLPEGKPNLLIENIPPQVKSNSLQVTRPEIYYGELTTDHVYVGTEEQEFDYPSGDENVYTSYEGRGGVTLSSFFRKLAFAWKFDGHRLIFSTYFTPESRILFHREIKKRVAMLAPFLNFDQDPYPVLTSDGGIKYIVDAYTTSSDYPYSEEYQGDLWHFRGNNYIRNSVKAVVDAYDGSVTFYIFDKQDIIIQTYQKIFPELFKSLEEMPADLRQHVRYPEDLLTVQAELYSTYHMQDVDVFYQREDVWQFATERYRENFQKVVPYYVMMHFPNQRDMEFVLMTPFTPKNKNVVNAWMAGRSDFPHYGKLIVFAFPKGVEVLGPRQIEARIDQNTEMSQAMTLWGQRGSEVIRGNLLAIPLFSEQVLYLLYAEPIYLQAEDAQLPEIKRIALADQQRVVWAENFDQALRRLIGEAEVLTDGSAAEASTVELVRRALESLNAYRDLIADGKFSEAGKRLEELNETLKQLSEGAK